MKTNDNDLQKILAKNIRVARAELHISQEELASRCGIHCNYIGAIERCECNVTLDTIWKLAQGLNKEPFMLIRD